MLNKILLPIVIALCFGSAANANSVNLVQNGSLELPYGPIDYIFHNYVPDWTITHDGTLSISSYWFPASDGNWSVNMDRGVGNLGTIQQAVSGLQTGHQYVLQFDYAANPFGPLFYPPPPYSLGFSVGDLIGSVTDASNDPNVAWQHYSAGFTFNGSNILSFSALSQGAALLDNVSLNETPLPAALPLFVTGLGALGLLGWQRRKKPATLAA